MKGPAMVIPGSIFGSVFLAFVLLSITAGTVPQTSPFNGQGQVEVQTSITEHDSDPGSTTSTPCSLSERYPAKIRQWCTLITDYSIKHGLEPDLIAALIWQESGGNPLAYSKSGAVGLMQVMPRDGIAESFMCVNGPCFSNRPSTQELQEPEFNIRYGTKMLAGLLQKKGEIREALKSYGPMDVGYYYADKVLGIYNNHRD